MKTKLLKKVRKNVWIEYDTIRKMYYVKRISRWLNVIYVSEYSQKENAFVEYRDRIKWKCSSEYYQYKKRKVNIIQIKHAEL